MWKNDLVLIATKVKPTLLNYKITVFNGSRRFATKVTNVTERRHKPSTWNSSHSGRYSVSMHTSNSTFALTSSYSAVTLNMLCGQRSVFLSHSLTFLLSMSNAQPSLLTHISFTDLKSESQGMWTSPSLGIITNTLSNILRYCYLKIPINNINPWKLHRK